MNNVIHIVAVTQLCENTKGLASYRRKRAEAKRPNLDLKRIAHVRRQVLSERPYRAVATPSSHSGAATPLGCGRGVRPEGYGSRIATTWRPRATASAARS